MSLLNELGKKYKTDKSTDGKRPGTAGQGHDYLRTYEKYLEANRLEVRSVLEVGVQKGASIRMWADYFPNAQIYGLDIAESALAVTGDRITIRLVDQSDATALTQFADECGPFDLIMEDGSHIWNHQIITLQTLLKYVTPGGKYIVEDLQTSYHAEWAGGNKTGVQYLLECCEMILGDGRAKAHDDSFLQALSTRVETIMAMRHAAVFFCK